MSQTLYILSIKEPYDPGEDKTILGIYSTEEKALIAMENNFYHPEFKYRFSIIKMILDQ